MQNGANIRGFTLIELLVTMGLMALLASVSIAGYYGAVRGMTERGARQDVISLLRLAKQRAEIDNVPTAVFFENRMLRDEDVDLGESKRIVGIAVVVRRTGRISYVKGNFLSDEFGDLPKTYPTYGGGTSGGGGNNSGMRLYKMDITASSLDNCYSTVRDYVVRQTLPTEELFGSGLNGGNSTVTLSDSSTFSANGIKIWAFEKVSGSSGNAQWSQGDAYGMEIASIQLPHGYVFGSTVPTQVGMSSSGGNPVFFTPQPGGAATVRGSLPDIRAYRPAKGGMSLKSIGQITSRELDDNN